MPSNINTGPIDITYPIAGQDNDTQGFRTNFTNIVSNLNTAGREITALQALMNTSLQHTGVPNSSTDAGVAGQIAYNSSYLYVCIDTDTWVRIAVTDTSF